MQTFKNITNNYPGISQATIGQNKNGGVLILNSINKETYLGCYANIVESIADEISNSGYVHCAHCLRLDKCSECKKLDNVDKEQDNYKYYCKKCLKDRMRDKANQLQMRKHEYDQRQSQQQQQRQRQHQHQHEQQQPQESHMATLFQPGFENSTNNNSNRLKKRSHPNSNAIETYREEGVQWNKQQSENNLNMENENENEYQSDFFNRNFLGANLEDTANGGFEIENNNNKNKETCVKTNVSSRETGKKKKGKVEDISPNSQQLLEQIDRQWTTYGVGNLVASSSNKESISIEKESVNENGDGDNDEGNDNDSDNENENDNDEDEAMTGGIGDINTNKKNNLSNLMINVNASAKKNTPDDESNSNNSDKDDDDESMN